MKKVYFILAIFILGFATTVTPSFAKASTFSSEVVTEEVVFEENLIKFVTEEDEKYTTITVYEGEEINVVKMDKDTENLYLNMS